MQVFMEDSLRDNYNRQFGENDVKFITERLKYTKEQLGSDWENDIAFGLKESTTLAGFLALLDGPLPIGEVVGLSIIGGTVIIGGIAYYKEHKKNASERTRNKHEKGNARRQRNQGGEKKNWKPKNSGRR
ncbi:hypothetical protein EII29_11010 [Leptotrichia sp. OH3620_COT-345]|uniref:hypothetical protein n=1 Tax=Leptotrichia sp. OH3620_COT-345 TaxID=2491048 RepID=UPI000F654B1D|nr:hypothetical protein [Leptotrichia sp. OH3620_COT-345]RRD37709.1 hypothetical protein EII29_11010 [Leptotrichia sp. OH3620_COT-345]